MDRSWSMHEAIAAWAQYCNTFQIHPRQCLGMSLPGHEKFPVTEAMVSILTVKGRDHGAIASAQSDKPAQIRRS